jgi:hypothetical protein
MVSAGEVAAGVLALEFGRCGDRIGQSPALCAGGGRVLQPAGR